MNNEFESIVSDGVKATLAYARDEWVKKAQSGLKSSREEYLAGLSGVYMEDSLSGYIELRGAFPVMTEEGYSSFDMKEGFAKSPKRTQGKDGRWYLTIPYRHTISSGPTAMPSNIYKQVKGLDHKKALAEFVVRQLGYKAGESWTGYQHKNSKYDSLTRFVKEYKSGKKRSQYVAFRRVSNNTDPLAWKHPGYRGLKAVDEVADKAEKFFYDYMEW